MKIKPPVPLGVSTMTDDQGLRLFDEKGSVIATVQITPRRAFMLGLDLLNYARKHPPALPIGDK